MHIPSLLRSHASIPPRVVIAVLATTLTTIVACAPPSGEARGGGEITIPRHTLYISTHYAIANLLPGGRNTPFTGIPVPSMIGADVADIILEDIVIPGLNQPVSVPIELILLNERNAEPFEVDGRSYEYFYTHNPDKRSLGKLSIVQTAPDDRGSAPEGFYMREMTIELVATLIPLDGGDTTVVPASVFIRSPVPIPFTFDPPTNVALKPGLVGDISANWHTDKSESQRNIFGTGVLQIPLAGRSQWDADRRHAMAGNKEAHVLVADRNGDYCPNDPAKDLPGLTGCGTSDVDSDGNGLPDFYESSLVSGGTAGGRLVGLSYDPTTGELAVRVPPEVRLRAINISSASGIFSGEVAGQLRGQWDRSTSVNLFKATFGETFGSVSFGNIARPGLTEDFLLDDVTVRLLFGDYESYGGVDLLMGSNR